MSFFINFKLKIYELKSPSESTVPSELISLNPAKASKANENTVVMHDKNTESPAFSGFVNLNTE